MTDYQFVMLLVFMAAVTIMAVIGTILYILVKRFARPKHASQPAATAVTAEPRKQEAPATTGEVVEEGPKAEPISPEKIARLKEYKELLDAEILTYEEFEAKKQQLLES